MCSSDLVVPDNRDPKLVVGAVRADFWDRVRAWQAAGWCIALHGYQHRYETRNAGLMGINAYSEFAGLPEDVQRDKLVRALAIFQEQGVRADAWVAPAHSFDRVTVRLLLELGLGTISDGFYFRPVHHLGATWIPQQLWHFRPMPGGLWTVCLHCNRYGEVELNRLQTWLTTYADRITTLDAVAASARPLALADWAFAAGLPLLRALRRRLAPR